MDINDLRKFLVIAELNNLQTASAELNQTAGALSKVIKRLETTLNSQLFDRVGRNIVLNRQGHKFLAYASHLVHEADQAISEFRGSGQKQTVNISGPAILMQHWLPELINQTAGFDHEFNINVVWEGEALSHVTTGQSHLALVTAEAVGDQHHDLIAIDLATTRFQVVAAKHSFNGDTKARSIKPEALIKYPFACPTVSHFCGIKRGVGSDGWRDDQVPRTIAYHCNDFSVMLSLVQQGRALAYVPDFVAEDHQFTAININDEVYEETIQLLYKPSLASGWLNRLVEHFK